MGEQARPRQNARDARHSWAAGLIGNRKAPRGQAQATRQSSPVMVMPFCLQYELECSQPAGYNPAHKRKQIDRPWLAVTMGCLALWL